MIRCHTPAPPLLPTNLAAVIAVCGDARSGADRYFVSVAFFTEGAATDGRWGPHQPEAGVVRRVLRRRKSLIDLDAPGLNVPSPEPGQQIITVTVLLIAPLHSPTGNGAGASSRPAQEFVR